MSTFAALRRLGPLDVRTIVRDPLLRWIMLLPLVVALLMRWLLPLLFERLAAVLGVDLLPWYSLVAATSVLLIAPTMLGMIVGFLLLDQRDDRTLQAIQVTPLPLEVYLAYWLVAPALASFAMTILALPLAGVNVKLSAAVPAALAAALLAPIIALALASIAENKVQGFALTKALSLFMAAPLVAVFVPMPWRFVFALFPTYWPGYLIWAFEMGEPSANLLLLVALAYSTLLVMLLSRRFTHVTHL